jgi:hypothetical protein
LKGVFYRKRTQTTQKKAKALLTAEGAEGAGEQRRFNRFESGRIADSFGRRFGNNALSAFLRPLR